ncbi:MAG: hypothetical protein AAGN66_25295 [Acidobacteriota bacterium]
MLTPDGGRWYRASPHYELVLFDRLTAGEKASFEALADRDDVYGLLRPAGEGRSYKAVGPDAALLWLTLKEPGPIPAYVLRSPGGEERVHDLVLDGVLEVLEGERFVSSAAALQVLSGGPRGPEAEHAGDDAEDPPSSQATEPAGAGVLGQLSLRAIRYAADLGLRDAEALAWRLYTYHTLPLTRTWRRRLPDADGVLDLLGLAPGSTRRRRLLRHWRRGLRKTPADWIHWSRRGDRGGPPSRTHKLYLSPRVEALGDAFGRCLDILAEGSARQFKHGANAAGLLRPDKWVLYFDSKEDLDDTARRLEGPLSGIEVHGVPFSAEVACGGLLSWGVDPEDGASWRSRESWRLWLCRQLATSITSAGGGSEPHPDPEVSPWRFALERLRRHGVDIDTWTPKAGLWRPEAGNDG